MKKALLALALAFPVSAFAGDAAPANDPRIPKIIDALQASGSTGAIEAWKVRDLGLPYSGDQAVPIRIDTVSEDIPDGKKRFITVSTLTIGKRYLLLARSSTGSENQPMIIAVNEDGTIVGGRWWRDEKHSDLLPGTRKYIYDHDVPMWIERLGVK